MEEENYLNDIKVGDTIKVECRSGMGTGGLSVVTQITTKYDEDSGRPYELIWCGKHAFDTITGDAWNPPYAYYIVKGWKENK